MITKTRKQAITLIKETTYQAINKKRYNFTSMEDTTTMCACGETNALYFEYHYRKQWHSVKVGYCANCGQDTTKGRVMP